MDAPPHRRVQGLHHLGKRLGLVAAERDGVGHRRRIGPDGAVLLTPERDRVSPVKIHGRTFVRARGRNETGRHLRLEGIEVDLQLLQDPLDPEGLEFAALDRGGPVADLDRVVRIPCPSPSAGRRRDRSSWRSAADPGRDPPASCPGSPFQWGQHRTSLVRTSSRSGHACPVFTTSFAGRPSSGVARARPSPLRRAQPLHRLHVGLRVELLQRVLALVAHRAEDRAARPRGGRAGRTPRRHW